MRVGVHMNRTDLKCEIPEDLPETELRKWAYQRYIKDYLRVGRQHRRQRRPRCSTTWTTRGWTENTLVIYTSDQGFFLGDHGWYDKRFMYEESLRMPFILRYPREVAPGSVNDDMVLNVDFAPLFLDLAGRPDPRGHAGPQLPPAPAGARPRPTGARSMYYRYWMHKAHHNVYAHYGVRTRRYKLIYYYSDALGQPGAIDETCRTRVGAVRPAPGPLRIAQCLRRPGLHGRAGGIEVGTAPASGRTG